MITLGKPLHTPAQPAKARVAALTFQILLGTESVGTINLRLGETEYLKNYGGNIGYQISEAHWNKGYATQACLLLKPHLLQHGFTSIWITCNPDNYASKRVCEKIGAKLIEIVDLPTDSDMYAKGERQKCRYLWVIAP